MTDLNPVIAGIFAIPPGKLRARDMTSRAEEMGLLEQIISDEQIQQWKRDAVGVVRRQCRLQSGTPNRPQSAIMHFFMSSRAAKHVGAITLEVCMHSGSGNIVCLVNERQLPDPPTTVEGLRNLIEAYMTTGTLPAR